MHSGFYVSLEPSFLRGTGRIYSAPVRVVDSAAGTQKAPLPRPEPRQGRKRNERLGRALARKLGASAPPGSKGTPTVEGHPADAPAWQGGLLLSHHQCYRVPGEPTLQERPRRRGAQHSAPVLALRPYGLICPSFRLSLRRPAAALLPDVSFLFGPADPLCRALGAPHEAGQS
jgi:hypothetical protein